MPAMARLVASPLFPSTSSSPASFHTAIDSEPGYRSATTTASSPAQAAASPYREARPLPPEIKDHCQILLEEQLCTSLLASPR